MNVSSYVLSTLFALSLVLPPAVSAECLTPSVKTLDYPAVELAFGGYIVGMNQTGELGVRVTFVVDRVWKGAVPKRFDLYVWGLRSENPRFAFGQGYMVFATRMLEYRARQDVGLTDPGVLAFEPISCGALDYWQRWEKAAIIKQFSEGRPPE